MARLTAMDKLADAISGILEEYAEDVDENVGEIAVEMGKQGAKALRAKSRETFPVEGRKKASGDYARGWKSQANRGRLTTTATIYNDHYSLPHLLEHGHVIRNGTGRVYGEAPGHEHIAPVADEVVKTFEREVLNRL